MICEIFSILIISTLSLKILKLVQLKPINHYIPPLGAFWSLASGKPLRETEPAPRRGYNNYTRCVLQRLKVS